MIGSDVRAGLVGRALDSHVRDARWEMHEERSNNGGNGDPQWTTRGVGEQLDESVAAAGGPIRGPGEGQGGERKRTAKPKARRRKARTTTKRKNTGQLRNPRERKARQLGPVGRARAGIGKKAKGKGRTAAGRRTSTRSGSPKAKRRKANRGTLPRRGR